MLSVSSCNIRNLFFVRCSSWCRAFYTIPRRHSHGHRQSHVGLYHSPALLRFMRFNGAGPNGIPGRTIRSKSNDSVAFERHLWLLDSACAVSNVKLAQPGISFKEQALMSFRCAWYRRKLSEGPKSSAQAPQAGAMPPLLW